jgi:hypothetical protein
MVEICFAGSRPSPALFFGLAGRIDAALNRLASHDGEERAEFFGGNNAIDK